MIGMKDNRDPRDGRPTGRRVRLEKRGNMWCVVMKSGALPYSSSDYGKAAGVHEFIQQGGFSQLGFEALRAEEATPINQEQGGGE